MARNCHRIRGTERVLSEPVSRTLSLSKQTHTYHPERVMSGLVHYGRPYGMA